MKRADETTVAGNDALQVQALPDVELLKPGDQLGSFIIEEVLGVGGMGCVYRARHKQHDRVVALKVLRPEYAANSRTARRFFSEARAANRIQHPNIIEISDFVEDAEQPFFVMEYLPGRPLADLIRTTPGPLQLDRALDISIQICRALSAAHDQGVIHRDLKPANVYLTQADGQELVKLLDFGVAKIQQDAFLLRKRSASSTTNETPTAGDRDDGDELRARSEDDSAAVASSRLNKNQADNTQSGAVLGTPEYMSPEQLSGKPITSSTDLYSFGLILYEMLAGKKAFATHSLGDAVLQHMTAKPAPLRATRQLAGALPEGLEHLVLDLLKKDPVRRPGNAAEVAERLSAIRRGQPMLTDASPARIARRRSWIAAAAALAVVTLLASMLLERSLPASVSDPARSAMKVEAVVESVPSGATVTLEGVEKPLGTTPLTTTLQLADGGRTVRVALEGYYTVFAMLRPLEGERVRVELVKVPAREALETR